MYICSREIDKFYLSWLFGSHIYWSWGTSSFCDSHSEASGKHWCRDSCQCLQQQGLEFDSLARSATWQNFCHPGVLCLSQPQLLQEENQKSSQTSKFCVRDAVSGDMWQVGILPSERECHKQKEKECCRTPESGVPAVVRHRSCNDIGLLTLSYLYRPYSNSSHWLNCHIGQQSSWYRRHDGKESYCTQVHVGVITLSHGRTWEKAQLCECFDSCLSLNRWRRSRPSLLFSLNLVFLVIGMADSYISWHVLCIKILIKSPPQLWINKKKKKKKDD